MYRVLKPTAEMMCSEDDLLREVLPQISSVSFVALIVVNRQNKLVGVMTDGDVRRALLRRLDLETPVKDVMNTVPVVGRLGDTEGNERALAATASVVHFLPVVDVEGRLACVWTSGTSTSGSASALIMAGGLGSRLGEHTRHTPKPMVEVAGLPMIEHVIRGLEAADIVNIHVSVLHMAEQIEDYVAQRNGRASLHILNEPERLGTAGAIGLLPKGEDGLVLVTNADVMTKVTYDAMIDFHIRHQNDATIAVARHEYKLGFGVVHHDDHGHFRTIEEKPTFVHFIAAGIYLLGPDVRNLVPSNTYIDMPDLLNMARNAGLKVGVFPVHEYWRDVGQPSDLRQADADLRDKTGDVG